MAACCPSGHELAWPLGGRACPRCRREKVVAAVSAADPSLPAAVIEAAVDVVAPGGQALRQHQAALAAGPGALRAGAPPVAGRLALELVARGSAALAIPACAVCGRAGKPLFRGDGGGVCQRCRAWQLAAACATCGQVRPAAGRDGSGRPVCEVCRRRDDPRRHRQCGRCGKTAPVAARARDGRPDTCVNCYRQPLGHLQRLRQAPGMQLRRDQPPGLRVVLAAGECGLRPVRPGPPGGRPLARGAGLRPVLHRRAAPPGPVRILRPAAPAGRAARPGR